MKYLNSAVVFKEIPNEISLAINITQCPHHCKGCHSPELREDIGYDLTIDVIRELVEKNNGITCLLFMGGDGDMDRLFELNEEFRKEFPNLKSAWYTGYDYHNFVFFNMMYRLKEFDYIKIGPYIEELGPINKETSNQIMLKRISENCLENITYLMRD